MTYEIEITRFTPDPATERHVCADFEAAAQILLIDDQGECVVFAAALKREQNLDLGNFYVWCNAERAFIRLDEHCEHYAAARFPLGEPTHDVSFRDENGSYFSVPYSKTLFRNQALDALRFWLPSQERSPELLWD